MKIEDKQMSKNKEIIGKLTTIMITYLLQLKSLDNPKSDKKGYDFLSTVPIFLDQFISSFAGLIDSHYPGAALHIYAELKKSIKLAGSQAIKEIKPKYNIKSSTSLQ